MPNSSHFGIPPRRPSPKVVPFGRLLVAGLVIIAMEVALHLSLPYVTKRYQQQLKRAENLLVDPAIVLRDRESLRMIPPVIGVIYRRQLQASPPGTEALLARLLPLSDEERLHLLRETPISDDLFVAVLARCYGGNQQESRLEEFLVRAVPRLDSGRYLAYLASDTLERNYFDAAQRSQYVGLIDEARLLYSRFVFLARILNREAALGVEMHRSINRANVRLKVLRPEHAFKTNTMRKIQTGPASVTLSFLNDSDSHLSALARYTAASFLWHGEQSTEAARLLTDADCGVLADECKFLLGKILNSQADAHVLDDGSIPTPEQSAELARRAGTVLGELIRRLPDNHTLLDDIYYHCAIVAQYREDNATALVALDELERRCPDNDLQGDVRFLRAQLAGRAEESDE